MRLGLMTDGLACWAEIDRKSNTMLNAPGNILQNEDLDDITEEDMLFNPRLQQPREIALRMSSTVRSPKDGFRFGRNPALCDRNGSVSVHL